MAKTLKTEFVSAETDELGRFAEANQMRQTLENYEGAKMRPAVKQGERGWRARKGYNPENTSGLHATGHRLLLATFEVEQQSEGGIIFVPKTVDKEKNIATVCKVVEIGHDAWADKSTDFCEVGDKVLIGQYVGKFHTSEKDGKEYRFVSDLDIITTVED